MNVAQSVTLITLLLLVLCGDVSQAQPWSFLWSRSPQNLLKDSIKAAIDHLKCGDHHRPGPAEVLEATVEEITRRAEATSNLQPFFSELDKEVRIGELINVEQKILTKGRGRQFNAPPTKGLGDILLEAENESPHVVKQTRKLSVIGEQQLSNFGASFDEYYEIYQRRKEFFTEANNQAQIQVQDMKQIVVSGDGRLLLHICFLDMLFAVVEDFQALIDRGRSFLEVALTINNLKDIYDNLSAIKPSLKSGTCQIKAKARGAFMRASKKLGMKAFEKLVDILVAKIAPGVKLDSNQTLEVAKRVLLYILAHLFSQSSKCI